MLYCQVLIFNLLPPPGSPPLQPDERGAAWSAPPLAVEVQAQVVDAMERVSADMQPWHTAAGSTHPCCAQLGKHSLDVPTA
jgi:hypothetical protein